MRKKIQDKYTNSMRPIIYEPAEYAETCRQVLDLNHLKDWIFRHKKAL